MSLALDDLVGTVELLEMILLALPLNDLLRARRVSRTCTDLIDGSKFLLSIRTEPYIGVSIQLPEQISISQLAAPELKADFVLYYDKPITIYKRLARVKHPSKMFFKFEPGTSPPEYAETSWGSKYHCRPRHFNRESADDWATIYPGVPLRFSWTFRLLKANHQTKSGYSLSSMEAGKDYILRLRPHFRVGHFVGVKDSLLVRKERGDDLKSYVLDKPLFLIGENEARFTAVP